MQTKMIWMAYSYRSSSLDAVFFFVEYSKNIRKNFKSHLEQKNFIEMKYMYTINHKKTDPLSLLSDYPIA